MNTDFLIFGAPLIEDAEIDEAACVANGLEPTSVAQFGHDFAVYKRTRGRGLQH